MFGKQDDIQGHLLKNEIVSLHPSSFETIEKLFTKFKSRVLQCRQCRIEQKDEKNVLSILSKLGSNYSIFVSIFHSKRESFPDWKIPSLNSFPESLIKEQDKLIPMGVIKTSKIKLSWCFTLPKQKQRGNQRGRSQKRLNQINKISKGPLALRGKRKSVPIV